MSAVPIFPTLPAERPLAPWRHTAVLVAIFLALTVAGALFQGGAQRHAAAVAAPRQPLPLYLSLMAGEWALVFYVWRGGLRRSHTAMRDVIGGRWPNAGAVLRDLALAAALWGVWALIGLGWDRVFPPDHSASIAGFLPRGVTQGLVWGLLSISAGFCEEFVFRGYLLRQFTRWTRSPWLAVVLQAGLFGIAHGYQGVQATARIAALGALYGALAVWRRSLRPGMMAHAATDILSGIFRV